MISTLLALPYELARFPVAVVDSRLSDRLPETSGLRVAMDRAIGSADRLVGTLVGNHTIAQRGTARIERSDKLRTAALLEQQAATRREQADEVAAAGRRRAAQKRTAAHKRAASGMAEADAAEARGKARATATARKTASTKKAAADQRAANGTVPIKQRKGRVDSAAQATKRAAQGRAKAELDGARKTQQAAREARADAERLGDLAEAKKRERTQG